ncbi:hypothetical protein L7F22_056301 [Adiantum nelumboides]|nr:hypothetical protein [Adiantum nelumboides]
MEYVRGKAAPPSFPFGGNHSIMQQSDKPTFEEICSIWDVQVSGTPDSVLALPHSNSPPLGSGKSSPSPFELDVEHMEFLLCTTQCDEKCPDKVHFSDLVTQGDQTMQESHDSCMYHHASYLSSTDHQTHSGDNHCEHIEEDDLVTDSFVEKTAKSTSHDSDSDGLIASHNIHGEMHAHIPRKQIVAAQAQLGVVDILRQHIKEYLESELQDELALCGCAHMGKREQDDDDTGTLDHHLECKMRSDYGIWVMWMQERRMQNEGIDLVQRLLACAEAVACRDVHQAKSLLQGVQELASPFGDSLQRIAFCFMQGLAARLNQHNNAGHNSFPHSAIEGIGFSSKYKMQSQLSMPHSLMWNTAPDEAFRRQEAFHSMFSVCPFVPFGHFIANSVILEAVEGEEAIHVIDLGMSDGLQWPALIHRIATRPSGPPKLLRITSVGTFTSQSVQEVGVALYKEAMSASVKFEFNAVHQPLENIAATELNLQDGEVIVVNSSLRLHCVVKESRGSLNHVLHAIHGLSPKVLTLVEQDANHNGPFFLGRFMEALHYYSAIFDSLQSALPRHSTCRINIEQCHLAHEIRNIVACEGPTRVERHERVDQWRRRMSRAGFQLAPIRLEGQARLWLNANYSSLKEDYTLSDEKGCLVLGWKGKPIIAASAWRC